MLILLSKDLKTSYLVSYHYQDNLTFLSWPPASLSESVEARVPRLPIRMDDDREEETLLEHE